MRVDYAVYQIAYINIMTFGGMYININIYVNYFNTLLINKIFFVAKVKGLSFFFWQGEVPR